MIAGVGIPGLLSFSVSRRSQELGIRRALGAQSRAIVGMVMREGVALARSASSSASRCVPAPVEGDEALLVGRSGRVTLTILTAAAVCSVPCCSVPAPSRACGARGSSGVEAR